MSAAARALLAADAALLAALEAGALDDLPEQVASREAALAALVAEGGTPAPLREALVALSPRLEAAARRRREQLHGELEDLRDTRRRLARAAASSGRDEPRFVSRRA